MVLKLGPRQEHVLVHELADQVASASVLTVTAFACHFGS